MRHTHTERAAREPPFFVSGITLIRTTTTLGHPLLGPVCTLSQWAIDNIATIHGAQGVFDEAGEVALAA